MFGATRNPRQIDPIQEFIDCAQITVNMELLFEQQLYVSPDYSPPLFLLLGKKNGVFELLVSIFRNESFPASPTLITDRLETTRLTFVQLGMDSIIGNIKQSSDFRDRAILLKKCKPKQSHALTVIFCMAGGMLKIKVLKILWELRLTGYDEGASNRYQPY